MAVMPGWSGPDAPRLAPAAGAVGHLDHARAGTAVVMGEAAFENEGHRLEPAMRVRTEGQPAIAGRVSLWAVMVEKQERIDLWKSRAGNRTARRQVLNIVAHSAV